MFTRALTQLLPLNPESSSYKAHFHLPSPVWSPHVGPTARKSQLLGSAHSSTNASTQCCKNSWHRLVVEASSTRPKDLMAEARHIESDRTATPVRTLGTARLTTVFNSRRTDLHPKELLATARLTTVLGIAMLIVCNCSLVARPARLPPTDNQRANPHIYLMSVNTDPDNIPSCCRGSSLRHPRRGPPAIPHGSDTHRKLWQIYTSIDSYPVSKVTLLSTYWLQAA